MALDADRYRLTEAEHQAIFDKRIKPQLFADAKPSDKPVAVIFGGQPGAGKSASVDDALRELKHRGGAAQIIGDDLRGYHPQYGRLMERDDKTAAFYTDRDTGRWVEKAIEHAKQQRLNVVIEGTMRDGNKVAETMQSLRGAGYEVDARALAVNDKLSWQGVMQRYENQKADRGSGRMTAPHSHRDAYEGVPATVERIEREKLADRMTVYRRGGEAIYTNALRDGQWQYPEGARQAVENERSRPMTLQERKDYAEAFDKLAALMVKPERRATADELRNLDELRTQARRELAAEVFRKVEPAEAVKTNPELAGAYGAVAAVAKKAEADGLPAERQAVVVARARENVAASIERGETPGVQMRDEVARGRSKDAER